MLKQKFLVQFGSNFSIKILGMVAGIFVARFAGPEVIGTIAFGTAYVSLFGFINNLFSTGHIKAISEGRDLGKCVSTYNYLQGSCVAIFFIVVLGWFLMQKYIIQYEFESSAQQLVIILLLLTYVATLILDFGNVTFTASLEQAKANYPIFVKSIFWHPGRIVLAVIGFKAVGLASWNLILTVLAIPLAWKFYKKLPRGGYSKELARKYWLIVPSMVLFRIFDSLINYSDKLFLVHYTSIEELGYYTVAFSIGGMFLLISHTAGMIFFPFFSQLISQNKWDAVNSKMHKYQSFIVLFIFPALCVTAIFGQPILLTLLGTRYQPSVSPFFIIIFATYINIVGIPYGNIITGMGRFYTAALIRGIKLIFFVAGLTFFVSPMFLNLGATGVAFNLLFVNLVNNLLFYIFSGFLGQIVFDWLNFWRHVLIVTLMVSVFFIFRTYDFSRDFLWLITAPSLLISVYVVLFLFRLIKYQDFVQVIDLLNINKTRQYIRDEFEK
jgi:O-antigen/teichoic acid export membrane protein